MLINNLPFILFGAAAMWLVLTFNRLIMLRQRVKNAWSQIDVQLKRRHDLIPNLVEAAKGYLSHERQTLENVIQARTQATQATTVKDKSGAENILTSALRSLFAVVEAYPELKANQNMLKLQEELATTENRISFARQYYNDEVMFYNTAIESIPSSIVAAIGNFKEEAPFEIENPSHREAPQLKI
jgi:LemA protein